MVFIREGRTMMGPLPLGKLVAIPGVLELLSEAGEDLRLLLSRHASGDWGDLDAHDRRENERSLKHGWRSLSSYPAPWRALSPDQHRVC
jgi:hypothetical protein